MEPAKLETECHANDLNLDMFCIKSGWAMVLLSVSPVPQCSSLFGIALSELLKIRR